MNIINFNGSCAVQILTTAGFGLHNHRFHKLKHAFIVAKQILKFKCMGWGYKPMLEIWMGVSIKAAGLYATWW